MMRFVRKSSPLWIPEHCGRRGLVAWPGPMLGPLGQTRRKLSSVSSHSLWYPATQTWGGASGYFEVGNKFYCEVDASLISICFWKHALATSSSHVVRLWSVGSPGTQLATITTSGEASGARWIVATLATPYAITANTNYIVSVDYSNDYFTSFAFTWPYVNGKTHGVSAWYTATLGAYPESSDVSYNEGIDIILSY